MTEWQRYRHKNNSDIEYDVESYKTHNYRLNGGPVSDDFLGRRCFRIRTVRNLLYREEVHQPAYTWMPADKFLEIYVKVA